MRFFEYNSLEWFSLEQLKSIIITNKDVIIFMLKRDVPECIHKRAIENIDYMVRFNDFL